MTPTQWFLAKGGQRVGPFSPDQLPELVKDGTLTPRTNVWARGFAGWKPAGGVPELAAVLTAAPKAGAPAAAPAKAVGARPAGPVQPSSPARPADATPARKPPALQASEARPAGPPLSKAGPARSPGPVVSGAGGDDDVVIDEDGNVHIREGAGAGEAVAAEEAVETAAADEAVLDTEAAGDEAVVEDAEVVADAGPVEAGNDWELVASTDADAGPVAGAVEEAEPAAEADAEPPAKTAPGRAKTGALRSASGRAARGGAAGSARSRSGSAPRKPMSAELPMSKGKKRFMLFLIFGLPLLCVALGGYLVWIKYFRGEKVNQVRRSAAAEWAKATEDGAAGIGKLRDCYLILYGGRGVVPETEKAKFDADLAEGTKIAQTTLATLQDLRKLASSTPSEWDKDIYDFERAVKRAGMLADEADRRVWVESQLRGKELLEAIQKLREDYERDRDAMTPETRASLAGELEKVRSELAAIADQWGSLLQKYAPTNKTDERPDPEDEEISRMNEANKNARMLLMELK
jgi:TPR repeat protein